MFLVAMDPITGFFIRFCTFCMVGFFVLAGPSSSFSTGTTLQKVPPLTVEQAPSYPENLARYHLGAQVEAAPKSRPIGNLQLSSNSADENAAEAALLCDDPTVGYALPAGSTTLLVSLPTIENIGGVAFVADRVKGAVSVATSNAKLAESSPQWHNALEEELSSGLVQANVGPREAKYVRLTFNLSEPGRIAGLGVYASPRISDFTLPRARNFAAQDKSDSFALISYNYTDIHAKGRALYVSSGSDVKQASNMIDDQMSTAYAFAVEDTAPTTVIDLGKPCSLRRLSAVYSPRPGQMEFYVLQSLPSSPTSGNVPNDSNSAASTGQNAPAALHIDDAAFANLKPVGSVSDDGRQGRASIDFPQTSGRYVMVRWTPATQADGAFSLAEVAAFGQGGQNTLLAANTGNSAYGREDAQTQDSDGKTMRDPKTMREPKDVSKENPESPAEGPPPPLPQPPPFTFIPLLAPASP